MVKLLSTFTLFKIFQNGTLMVDIPLHYLSQDTKLLQAHRRLWKFLTNMYLTYTSLYPNLFFQ